MKRNADSIDQSLAKVVAALNTVTPADGLLVAGSDGTDLRALKTDASGQLVISNPGGGATPQTLNGALVAEGILAVGSDGTDGRAISTDANGRQIPLVPTLSFNAQNVFSNTQVIAAPTSGALYLFDYEWWSILTGQTTLSLISGGSIISNGSTTSQNVSQRIPLRGFRITGALLASTNGNQCNLTIRYAPGP